MKLPARGALVLAGLLGAAFIAVSLSLGRIVKGQVEKEGTQSLHLATALDGAIVSLLGGKLGLRGLRIDSPHGFPAPHMFELGASTSRSATASCGRTPSTSSPSSSRSQSSSSSSRGAR